MTSHPLKTHIEEIVPISDEEFEKVLRHFTEIRRRKHQFLIEQGESVGKEYWVIEGALKAYFFDYSGKEHIIQFALENWWTTDYRAFHKGEKAEIFVDCIEDSKLLFITLKNKEKLSKEMHKMEHFWAIKTKLAIIAAQSRLLSLLKDSAKVRHDKLLQLYPQFFQRLPKKMIASYLDVSRETLSRFSSE